MASPEQRLKILVIYENGAGGHRGAALAIAEALKRHPGVEAPTLELDTLTPKFRKRMYTTFMDIRPFFAPIVRYGFSWGLRPNPLLSVYRGAVGAAQPWSLRRFLDVVASERPDLIVSTHFRPDLACDAWLRRGQLRTPVHAIVVDYVAHGLYARPHISRYYVASEAVKEDLTANGVVPERIEITGLPVSQAIMHSDGRGQAELRRELGLDPERPLLLVMGGARGDQDYELVLRKLESERCPAQVVVLCGWNRQLKEQVERIAASLSIAVHVKGFQRNMADWYRAADLILTKPGGMTSAEALALGKPFVICSPHPGKEEVQAERLAAAGVALYEPTPEAAVAAAVRILGSPAELLRMAAATQRLGRLDAADHIAGRIIAAAEEQHRAMSRAG